MAIIIKERFEVDPEALLGEGAFGAVVRAVDRANGDRAVACKIINTAQFTREAIDLECSVLEAVRGHPNIVDLLDYHHDDARAVSYVFMELVPGSELFERVTTNTDPQGRLTESQARPLFLELVRAVKHCHCKGVAHRDLKLDNVLVTPDGELKLLDFGLAAKMDTKKMCHDGSWDDSGWKDVCGTRPYAAPEVLRANAGYGCFAADVWSLGICLFAMCAGFFPLDEATQRDWRFARLKYEMRCGKSAVHVIHSFYSRECSWSAPLVSLVNSMLVAEPCKRASLDSVLRSEWLCADEETRSCATTAPGDSVDMAERLASDLHGWQLAHEMDAACTPHGVGALPSPSANADGVGVASSPHDASLLGDALDDEDDDDDHELSGGTRRARFFRAISPGCPFGMVSTDTVPEVRGVESSYSMVFRGTAGSKRPCGDPVALRRCAAFREQESSSTVTMAAPTVR